METGRLKAGDLKSVRSGWSTALLVCRKCSKRLDGGFGPKGRTSLAKALRKELGVGKGRKGKLGVIEVKCLGVCPRGAVTIVDAARPGEWKIVPARQDIEEIVSALRLNK
ncbi:MAG: (2Fe-2S) ferredoxin domain-containing protein [Pseudomonadota bacterium]|uniref:(2Fe-2S) ferredoxin domain-containing protein n=1 Tax=Sphingomonas sp. ERG5 TaxID=1381597 RepID=UPI00054B7F32|nr:(2Fe-2S) ferredoxin domain-containing protein [Sphingomonas sp. ERG5]